MASDDFGDIQSRVVFFTLENGLTVILYPRSNAPVIACVTYIKAGSADEHNGITGIAHQLEHLAFKGTPRVGVKSYDAEKKILQEVEQNQYANIIARHGGVGLEASTNADRTVYHVSLPANKLELWAALESDRLLNAIPRQFEKEKLVVLEERQSRADSTAFDRLYETLLSAAFQTHPYGHVVIGSRADILNYTRDQAISFYRRHYTPRNTIIAITGDIDASAARKIIADYFSRMPVAQNSEEIIAAEPPQTAERRVEVESSAQPLVLAAYHIPERHHLDTPALALLNEIISTGRASRLYARLVKTGKAAAASSWIGPGARFPRLLYFSVEPIEGGDTDELEAALLAEIEKLKTEPLSDAEMHRVITRYRAQVLCDLRSNLELARQLADYQAISGDWRALFNEIQQICAVKSEQITTVAQKYLIRQNCVFGRIISTNPPTPRISPPTSQDSILGISVK